MQYYNVYRSTHPNQKLGVLIADSEAEAIQSAKEKKLDIAPIVCAVHNCDSRAEQPSEDYLYRLRRIAASHDGEKPL